MCKTTKRAWLDFTYSTVFLRRFSSCCTGGARLIRPRLNTTFLIVRFSMSSFMCINENLFTSCSFRPMQSFFNIEVIVHHCISIFFLELLLSEVQYYRNSLRCMYKTVLNCSCQNARNVTFVFHFNIPFLYNCCNTHVQCLRSLFKTQHGPYINCVY